MWGGDLAHEPSDSDATIAVDQLDVRGTLESGHGFGVKGPIQLGRVDLVEVRPHGYDHVAVVGAGLHQNGQEVPTSVLLKDLLLHYVGRWRRPSSTFPVAQIAVIAAPEATGTAAWTSPAISCGP